MKTFKYFVSSTGWEYSNKVLITANAVEHLWSSDWEREYYARNTPTAEGDIVIADGVRIQFDEPFEFVGEEKNE